MTTLDRKTLKKIDSLVNQSKSMIILCVVGIFIPLVLLIETFWGSLLLVLPQSLT